MTRESESARGPGCLSDLALDRVLDGAPRDGEAAHITTCDRCGARLQTLRGHRDGFLARARPSAFVDDVLARRRRRRWLRLPFALGPLLLGAAGLALLLGRAPSLPRPVGDEGGVREKGAAGAPVVELFVRSGGERANAHPAERFVPGRPLVAGDALQLLYTAARPCWLVVLDVEAADGKQGGPRAEILYRSPAPLPAGTRRPLEKSFVLDGSARAERLHVLSWDSASPPDEAALLAAARAADPAAEAPLPVAASGQTSWLLRR